MFARWVTRCFWVKDKRKRHPSGPVGPSQTNPSKSGECHQQELHGSTAKHCHFHIHTLTRNQKDWECWWMSVWTAYNTVNHLLDRHGTAGSHSWKSTNLGMCVTGLRDRQAQNVSLENCMWLSVVYTVAVFCEKWTWKSINTWSQKVFWDQTAFISKKDIFVETMIHLFQGSLMNIKVQKNSFFAI